MSAELDASPRQKDSAKEFDLLCACAGVELSVERIAHVAEGSHAGVNWQEFLRLAEHNGVLPLVAHSLQSHAQELPTDVAQSLRSGFETHLRRNLWFAGELVRIADRFEKSGLRAIPYKGPVLAESAYGDLALRNFSDLDFLISRSDFVPAKTLLAELGYHPSTALRPAVERFWLRKGYECSFDSADGKHLVELQWGLLPYFYAIDLQNDELLSRAARTLLGGREVAGLSPEDSLLALSLHAAKHLWSRLIWVCDIAEALRAQTVNWEVVLGRARSLGILRIVGVGFWLVQRLLGADLPPAARETIADDPEISVLGRELGDRLARGATYDLDSPDYFHWFVRLRERRSDQCRYLWRLVWTPGPGDLEAVQMPERLFPLYRAVRVLRLARKFW